jgi:hypothetical protein
MITKKYEYIELLRENTPSGRVYVTPGQQKLPSVTTILDKTKNEEKKQSLQKWRDSIGNKKAEQITTESSSRGTRLHKYLENYILNSSMSSEPSNPFAKASHLMAKEVITHGLSKVNEFWGVEVGLYFPSVYAGTTDLVGVYDNKPSIIDFKQSNKEKKSEWIEDYFLQLAAYAECHNEIYSSDIKQGVIMMAIKPLEDDKGNIIETPKYREFVISGSEFEYYRKKWWQRVEQYWLSEKI